MFANMLCCFSWCTAILTEQQAGNRNVAVTSLHCLLLHNVYSPSFGVSHQWNKCDANTKSDRSMCSFCHLIRDCYCIWIYRPHAAANFYQRALLANALTSALRLHQRLPHFQLSRAFLAQALQEDSCHYLLYSLILVNSYPITSILSKAFIWQRMRAAMPIYILKVFWKPYVVFIHLPCSWQID